MIDPASALYLGLPGYVVLWILAIVAFYLFGRRVRHFIEVLRSARREPRWDQLARRALYVLKNVFVQPRLLNEPAFGVAHFLIFWTFVFYASSFFWNLLRGLLPFLPVPYIDEIPAIGFVMELLSVAALIALGGAALRRYVFTPPRLERTFDASFVLVLIAILLVTFLGGQGFKALAEARVTAASPIGGALGRGFSEAGLAPDSGEALYVAMWWVHMVTVLSFLAYLPYSKHVHLLAAPFSVFFASLRSGGMPPASEGAADLEQFTWRQLFNALACAECGRCDRACPAFNSGFALSPKELIHGLREMVLSIQPGRLAAARVSGVDGNGNPTARLLGERVTPDAVWSCTTCMACMQLCPVFNEHIPLLTEMRRYMVSRGEIHERVQDVMMALTRYGNSFGKSQRARPRWTQGLDFKIKDARKEPVEYLWFVGDYASYDPRLAEATRATARVFRRAGLDFGILYDGERNSGGDVRRVGEEGLYDLLKTENLDVMKAASFQKIVTTDPHSYHTLKNEYDDGNGELKAVSVYHYSELLDRLVADGRLNGPRSLNLQATYHDPCYLGRYSGVYEEPRRVMRSIGVTLLEMPRTRARSYCCGGGGGRIWMEDAPGIKERPAESRVEEAANLPGVETLVVSCPKDLVMFQDAIKTRGLAERLVVRDLIDLVQEATFEPADQP